jgi:hypothetical protein
MIERELPLILNGIEKINPALAMGDQVRLSNPEAARCGALSAASKRRSSKQCSEGLALCTGWP